MYEFYKNIPVNGLRNPRIINFQENFILLGSSLYKQENKVKKYVLVSYLLDNQFNVINNTKNILDFKNIDEIYLDDIYTSIWLRDLYHKNNQYYLLVEFKKNIENKHLCPITKLCITNDFKFFDVIKDYPYDNLIFKDYNNIIFSSKLYDFEWKSWGVYLFEFINCKNEKYTPKFDINMNSKLDNGHLLHYITRYNDNKYKIIFSIRKQLNENELNFKYQIYTAETKDFINFYNTKEIQINDFKDSPKWYSYPSIFYKDKKEYIICNQDDFGKETNPLILKKVAI